MGTRHKKEVVPKKRHFFHREKLFEDVRQDEKHVPDLLESIMRPTDAVTSLFKTNQIRAKIQKSRLQLFGSQKSKVFPPEANASLLAGRLHSIFGRSSGQILQKCRF